MKVTHVIGTLSDGGAEIMLYRLLSQTDNTRVESRVISLRDVIEPWGIRLRDMGIPVQTLGLEKSAPNPISIVRLARMLRKDPPDVVQTWMWHSDLIGGLTAKLAGGIPVAWGVHSSGLEHQSAKRTTVWASQLCSATSSWLPERIVCCAESSRRAHEKMGYPPEKMRVIYNGFDLSQFKPDPSARPSVRGELGVDSDTLLIGMMGRFDAPKDHRNFIRAAALLRKLMPGVEFVLCGMNVDRHNETLNRWIREAGVHDCFHLLGRRADVPRITAALDVASLSSSYGEAFPLVLGEAMACGVPCVTTDVGDSAVIVGDTGCVAPPRDPVALAESWMEILEMSPEGRAALGRSARRRIKENFDLSDTVLRYEELYTEMSLAKRTPADDANSAKRERRSVAH